MNVEAVRIVREPPKRRRTFNKGAFYRLCRLWHGYLSAFAFLALIFFSASGILLNHPEWFAAAANEQERSIVLSAADIAAACAAPVPSEALAALIDRDSQLRGNFSSGEILDGEAYLHFEGAKGTTDATIDLETGEADIIVRRASAVSVLHELHRGTKTGTAWRAVIDIAGGLILALSLIGYILFVSLRTRWASTVTLTALSATSLIALFLWFVP